MTAVVWLIGLAILGAFLLVVLRGAPYVPSHPSQLRRAFGELYKIGAEDVVVDLGSGDGVVLRYAARRGATAIGYELNPWLVIISRFLCRRHERVSVKLADYQNLSHLPSGTTVVYAFTTAHSIETIGKKVAVWSKDQDLWFISYGFTLKDTKPVRSVGPMHLYKFPRQP